MMFRPRRGRTHATLRPLRGRLRRCAFRNPGCAPRSGANGWYPFGIRLPFALHRPLAGRNPPGRRGVFPALARPLLRRGRSGPAPVRRRSGRRGWCRLVGRSIQRWTAPRRARCAPGPRSRTPARRPAYRPAIRLAPPRPRHHRRPSVPRRSRPRNEFAGRCRVRLRSTHVPAIDFRLQYALKRLLPVVATRNRRRAAIRSIWVPMPCRNRIAWRPPPGVQTYPCFSAMPRPKQYRRRLSCPRHSRFFREARERSCRSWTSKLTTVGPLGPIFPIASTTSTRHQHFSSAASLARVGMASLAFGPISPSAIAANR